MLANFRPTKQQRARGRRCSEKRLRATRRCLPPSGKARKPLPSCRFACCVIHYPLKSGLSAPEGEPQIKKIKGILGKEMQKTSIQIIAALGIIPIQVEIGIFRSAGEPQIKKILGKVRRLQGKEPRDSGTGAPASCRPPPKARSATLPLRKSPFTPNPGNISIALF